MKRVLYLLFITIIFISFSKDALAAFKNVKSGELNNYELLCQYELKYKKTHYLSIYGNKNKQDDFAIVYRKEGEELEKVMGSVSELNGNGTFSNSKSVTNVRVTGCPSAAFIDLKGAEKEVCFTQYYGKSGSATRLSSNCALEKNTGTNYGKDLVSSTLTANNTGVDPQAGLAGSDVNEDFSGKEDCSGFLGDKTVAGTPAHYLHIVLITMRYLAIILTLALSMIDFFKAIFSQDKDLIKKAAMTAAKRLIFAVLIFFIPTILEFILSLLGAYSVNCV